MAVLQVFYDKGDAVWLVFVEAGTALTRTQMISISSGRNMPLPWPLSLLILDSLYNLSLKLSRVYMS